MEKKNCPNCNCEIDTPYCPCCGQRYGEARLSWNTLWEGVMSTFIGEGFRSEKGAAGRYGMLGTLWQVLRHPVRTTTEFLAGHRRRYFNPVALLLLLSGLFALLNMLVGAEVLDHSRLHGYDNAESVGFVRVAMEYANSHPAVFVLLGLPMYALACRWVFRPCKLRYIEFLYIELFASIVMLVILCIAALLPFGENSYFELVLKSFPMFCVEVAIYHRIFGSSILRTAGNMLLVHGLASLTLFLGLMVMLFIGVLIFVLTLLML